MHLSWSTTLAGAWQSSGGVCKARRPHTQTQMGDWSPWRANVREGGRADGRTGNMRNVGAGGARSFICYAGMWHDFHGILTEVATAQMRTRICKSVLCLPRVVPPFHSSSKYCNLCTSKVFRRIACTARAARRGKTKPFRDSSCRYCFKLNDMSSHNPISEYTQLGCPQPLCAPLMHEN